MEDNSGEAPSITEEDAFSIFQEQDKVVDKFKEAAESVGAGTKGIDSLKGGKGQEFILAKKNCRMCWGQGLVDFVANEKKHQINTSVKEDRDLREKRKKKALCGCVKIQMG